MFLKFSLVVTLDLEKDLSKLEKLVAISTKGSSYDKTKLLCEAIHTTNEAGHMISISELFKITFYLVKLNKVEKTFKESMQAVSFKARKEVVKADEKSKVIFDKDSLVPGQVTRIRRLNLGNN